MFLVDAGLYRSWWQWCSRKQTQNNVLLLPVGSVTARAGYAMLQVGFAVNEAIHIPPIAAHTGAESLGSAGLHARASGGGAV